MDSALYLKSEDNLKCISVVEHDTESLEKRLKRSAVQTGKLRSGNSKRAFKRLLFQRDSGYCSKSEETVEPVVRNAKDT